MKLFAAIAAVCLSVPALAQVQIGKSVQLGGANSGGSGTVNAGNQRQLAGYPNAGSAAVVGPGSTTLNYVSPIIQSQANSDQWINGGGNNGVANAVAGGQTDILIPVDSTSTENPVASLTSGLGIHVLDRRGGIENHFFLNASPNTTTRIAAPKTFLWNQQPTSSQVIPTAADWISDAYYSPGINAANTWSTHQTRYQLQVKNGRGIAQAHRTLQFVQAVGDAGGDYLTQTGNGGSMDGSGEDMVGRATDQNQGPYPTSGTVITGSTGSMTIKTSFANSPLSDGPTMVNTSDVEMTGNILSVAVNSYPVPDAYTTSDTHAVSPTKGFLTATCGAYTVRNAPASASCAFTQSGGRGTFVTTAPVCIADSAHPEVAQLTAVGATLTMNLTYQHPSGTPLYQGRPCGARVLMGYGASPVTVAYPTSYFVAGSDSSTTFAGIVMYKENQNGQVAFPVPSWSTSTQVPAISLSIASASGTGSTVTLSLTNPYGSIFNNFTPPTGTSVCVSGSSVSAYNHCSIASITASGGGWVLTYPDTATGSGTGGNIMVATTGAPTTNSLANYTAMCGAETTAVLNANASTLGSDGTVNLEANDCAWSGASVFQPPFYAQHFQAQRNKSIATTMSIANANVLLSEVMGGFAWDAGIYHQPSTTDSLGAYYGYGGTIQPRTYINDGSEYFHNWIQASTPPLLAKAGALGCVLCFGAFPANSPTSQYYIWGQQSNTGKFDQLLYDANADSISFTNNTNSTTLNVGGTIDMGNNLGKVKLFDDGTPADSVGIGVAASENQLFTSTGAHFSFRVGGYNGTEVARIDTSGNIRGAGFQGTGTNPSISTGTASNTDVTGELTFSGATSATYTWANTYGSHPEVTGVEPQFDPGSGVRHWVTYTGTTSFTINFSSAVTGQVSYGATGRN